VKPLKSIKEVSCLDVTQLVKSRRSIRRFKAAKVSHDVIHAVMDLAMWAPSAHNAQPWRFVVIDDGEVKRNLAAEMGKAWLSDMLRDGVPRDKAEGMRLDSCDRITRSPVVAVACLSMEDMHRYPDSRRRKAEYVMAVQSVAAYIQTLLLIARYYKLGACWMCAPLFCRNTVRKVLGLPKKLEPQAMIIMGYADEKPSPPPRKTLDEVCAFNIWSKC
jgi:coenzyme F420-0:L-glutamate ligase/coenzyme F420-1:gamma-L-glutamate ligase